MLLRPDHFVSRGECLYNLLGIFLNGRLAYFFCQLSKSYSTLFLACLSDVKLWLEERESEVKIHTRSEFIEEVKKR